MQQMKARDKYEVACVVAVAALAIFYAIFAMMIRGFVSMHFGLNDVLIS